MASESALARLPQLENLTLWQRVYDHLQGEILAGRLGPGAELAEVALAEQLGVSRGPIREAIRRLASEGLVTVRPRRGAVVSLLSKEEFLELYQVREALEMMAVRLAVPRLQPTDIAALQALIDAMAAHAERGQVAEFFEANAVFHARLVDASGNAKLGELYRQLLDQLGRYRTRSLRLRGNLQRSVAEHAAILRAAKRGDADRASHLMSEHIRVPQRRLKSLSDDQLAAAEGGPTVIAFGVNLNNREPLIAPDYDLPMLLDLSEIVEESGFDSVWVGDSLFSKPRYEPISLLSAISQRTSRVRLGTACMVSSTRNPLYLALEWATLDVISGGRTIFGAGMGNPEQGVRREFEALGLDYVRRGALFEEGLAVIRAAVDRGAGHDFHGRFLDYDDVSFFSGTEMAPLMPIQPPPPIWVVSNPRLKGDAPPE